MFSIALYSSLHLKFEIKGKTSSVFYNNSRAKVMQKYLATLITWSRSSCILILKFMANLSIITSVNTKDCMLLVLIQFAFKNN